MYKGNVVKIPLGIGGLHTDDPQNSIPPSDLIRANNISLYDSYVEKAPGSKRFNNTALGSGIVAAIDWWPDDENQRMIAVTRSGKVYRIVNYYTQAEVLASGVAPSTLQTSNQTSIVAGGAEASNRNRKLFIMDGVSPIQVISGDGATRSNMSKPSVDWSANNYPNAGIIHHGRLMVWGCKNNPHQIYASNPNDHEDFQTFGGLALNLVVYPGEGEKILSAEVFKGRMFIFKKPFGVYYLDDTDSTTTNWAIFKYSSNFGAASFHACCQPMDDMLVANNFGTITSYKAVQYYGGVELGDVLKNSRSAKFVRENMSIDGTLDRQAVYYEDKRLAMFTYRSAGNTKNDRICIIDYNQQTPRVTWYDKDQPNCIGLRKDDFLIQRPFYGAEDGYIYLMDQPDRNVGGASYTGEFMTPHLDFSFIPQIQQGLQSNALGSSRKLFDFLSVKMSETGKWPLTVEVYIDGLYSETIQFPMAKKRALNEFRTNIDRTYDGAPLIITRRLHGTGKTIAFRCYNSGLDQNFKIMELEVGFRIGNIDEKEE